MFIDIIPLQKNTARLTRVYGDAPCAALPASVPGPEGGVLAITELGDYCFSEKPRSLPGADALCRYEVSPDGTCTLVQAFGRDLTGQHGRYDLDFGEGPAAPEDLHPVCGNFVEEITLPDSLLSDIPGSDQAQAEKDILAGMGQNIKTVPLHDALNAHRTEYIYFRTDHHWTALGAYYAYVQFCNVKGITPHDLSDYGVSQYTGFLGSFYNDGGKPQAMADDPDTVNPYHPVSSPAAMKYGSSEDSELTGGKVIFDESTAAASLKYGTFIMGDNPFTVIENPEVSNGQSCIVVKESFGNAFVPFLVDHYQTVYVVDYRYYGGSVSTLAKAKGVTDVLFVNNLSAIRGSYQMGKLAGVK